MRRLQFQDVFRLARIMKMTGIKNTLQDRMLSYEKQTEGLDEKVRESYLSELGMDIAFSLLDCCSEKSVEAEIYELLAGIFEMKVDDVKGLDFGRLCELLKQFAKENDLKSFFTTAGRSTTTS